MIIVDVETKSEVDLKAEGDYKYVNGDEADILVLCWFDLTTEERGTWHPGDELPFWATGSYELGAFNARFERLVWEHILVPFYDFPEQDLRTWYCVAAQCRLNNLPGKLDKVGQVLFGRHVKRASGMSLIKQMCIPPFEWTPQLQSEMDKYCLQDVLATVDVHRSCRPMTAREREDWEVNERINDRGVAIDTELAELAVSYADREAAEMARELSELTEGHVTKHTQTQRIKNWVMDRTTERVHGCMATYKDGEKKYSLDKNARQRIMEGVENGLIDVHPTVLDVIEIVDETNKSSVAKFRNMLNRADEDGLVRGSFIHAGATPTNRYVSRGLQLHNMKRACCSEAETNDYLAHMREGRPFQNTMQALSRLLRPAIVGDLVVCDWSAIEARVLPWAADSFQARERLNYIERTDEDPGLPDLYTVTSDDLQLGDRQIGKVAELSLGYCGGVGAFAAMGRNYGVNMTKGAAQRIVDKWRAANYWAVDFADQLERAANAAIQNRGFAYTAGRVSFQYYWSDFYLRGILICTLPSGDVMQYYDARIDDIEKPWGTVKQITAVKANWTPKSGETEWPRIGLWRGLLAENVTQGIAAALLREALVECEIDQLPVVAHVHDEIVLDCDLYEGETRHAAELLQQIMETPPEWAEDLPLKAVPTMSGRYGKE